MSGDGRDLVRIRHYTSRARSLRIEAEGVIRTGARGAVFCESANRRVRAPHDVEDLYGLERGHGRDYVEVGVPRGWVERTINRVDGGGGMDDSQGHIARARCDNHPKKVMESTAQEVPVQRDRLLEIARDMNTLVVSLDRIGSYYADDRAAFERALAEFLIECNVTRRLARARRIVDEALIGPNPTPEEQEALPSDPFWEPKP